MRILVLVLTLAMVFCNGCYTSRHKSSGYVNSGPTAVSYPSTVYPQTVPPQATPQATYVPVPSQAVPVSGYSQPVAAVSPVQNQVTYEHNEENFSWLEAAGGTAMLLLAGSIAAHTIHDIAWPHRGRHWHRGWRWR